MFVFPVFTVGLFNCDSLFCDQRDGTGKKGTIAGHVADKTGAVLVGAQIQLQPGGTSVTSNEQGDFTLVDLVPGNYHLAVSYVGFQSFESDITLSADESKHLDVNMDVASQGESIIVTAERARGEAEAINLTRAADNILQVLPAEVITSLPNANVADALGRMPSVTLEKIEGEGVYWVQVRGTEPRLTNVTINGIYRAVSPSLPCGRCDWTYFLPIWWSRWRSIKRWRRIWMATASAVRSI